MMNRFYITKNRLFAWMWSMLIVCSLLIPCMTVRAADSSTEAKEITFEDLSGLRGGVKDGSIQDSVLKKLVGNPEIVYFKSVADECIALDLGKVDYVLVVQEQFAVIAAEYDNLTLIPQLSTPCGELGYIFAKNDRGDALRHEMDTYIRKVRDSGELKVLQDYWFTTGEKKTVDLPSKGERGTLTIASACASPPYFYIVEDKYAGFEAELLERFCKENGYGVKIEVLDFSGILPAVTTGKCDIAANCLMKTKEREEEVNFSETTSQPMYTILMRKDLAKEFADIDDTSLQSDKNFFRKTADSFKKTFIVEARWKMILRGCGVTILLTLITSVIGLILGLYFYKWKVSKYKVCRQLIGILNSIMGGMPMVVLLMIFYYIIFGKVNIPAFFVAVIAFGLNFSSVMSEIYYTCIKSIDPGQTEAALALGYSDKYAFRRFIFPQAMLRALPLIRGQIVSLLKGTAIVGYISIQDLTKMGDIIRSRTYEAFFPLIAVAAIYFAFAWLIRVVVNRFELRLDPIQKRIRRMKIDQEGR